MIKSVMIGTGRGRARLEMLDNGCVQLRMRTRTPGDDNYEASGPYHRVVIDPDNAPREPTMRGFPSAFLDEEMYADTGVTLADVVEGYIRAHRTPERLKRWELQKAEIAEAERLEMDAPRER